MSLIPYQHQEGREIVLRHRNAIVVRDSTSNRLEIRSLTECPTCHRPMPRAASPERSYENPYDKPDDSFVDPNYFRMLRNRAMQAPSAPQSSIRRLSSPPHGNYHNPYLEEDAIEEDSVRDMIDETIHENVHDDSEFVSSTPGVSRGQGNRIRRQAFSPGYFKTFFKEERVLGRGGKGVVLLVRHEIDQCDLGHYACKRVPVGDDHAWLEKVLVEVGLLNKLSHPNLVSYRHVWLENAQITQWSPSVPCAFILQQYCNGGDLHQYIVGGTPREETKEELKERIRRRSKGQADIPKASLSSRQLSFDEIYSMFRDIASGVEYLHKNGYIHRDLKPSNCLLHRQGGVGNSNGKPRCLISDFGEVQPENAVRSSTGATGTISYCAPEVLRIDDGGQYGNFTTKSDMFSLGMILYFMCFGKLPYLSANAIHEELEDIDELRAEITDWRGFHDERRDRPDLPPQLYQLLQKLLSVEPAQRPSASEVLGAMRGQSLAEINRGERSQSPSSSSLGLATGGRFRQLDHPPSSPILHEPYKQFMRRPNGGSRPVSPRKSEFDDDGIRGRSEVRNVNNTPLRPLPMAITDATTSPDQPYSESLDHHHHREGHVSRPLLLLPPTNNPLDTPRQWLNLLMSPDRDTLSHLIRLSFFLIKLASLTQPCSPFTPRLPIALSLALLAGLDLVGPTRMVLVESRSLALFMVHGVVLWIAGRWDALCVETRISGPGGL